MRQEMTARITPRSSRGGGRGVLLPTHPHGRRRQSLTGAHRHTTPVTVFRWELVSGVSGRGQEGLKAPTGSREPHSLNI